MVHATHLGGDVGGDVGPSTAITAEQRLREDLVLTIRVGVLCQIVLDCSPAEAYALIQTHSVFLTAWEIVKYAWVAKHNPVRGLAKLVEMGNEEGVKLLVAEGADIHLGYGVALYTAAECGHLGILNFLLDKDNFSTLDLNEALCIAAVNGHQVVSKRLINAGADLHARNELALRRAAANGQRQIVQMLLELGARIHTQNDFALRAAATRGHLDVVKLLLEKSSYTHTL
eukprot:jgi/Chrzof1/9386/Cz04g01040.t1